MGTQDKLVARRLFDAINDGKLGRHFRNEAVAVLTIADGKVTEVRGAADRMGMLTQLGVLPDLG